MLLRPPHAAPTARPRAVRRSRLPPALGGTGDPRTGLAQPGTYDLDVHGLVIATLAVPAAGYFLWVVLSLHRGTIRHQTSVHQTVSA